MQIIITRAANPQWANSEHSAINLDVDFEHMPEETVRFTASATDSEQHGRFLFTQAEAGEYGNIAPFVAPPVVVPQISKRQFLIMAGLSGLITEEEAKDAATQGAVPASIQVAFDGLPPADKFAAEVTWATMTVLSRNEPLVMAAATVLGLNSGQVDNFFIQAAQIP